MTRVVHRREDWTDAPQGCSDRFDPDKVVGVAIHWVGSGLSEDLRLGRNEAVAAFLRQCRAANVADGYCDIEYNLAVGGDGDLWYCRGLEFDGGANGTTDANDRFVSILVIYPVGGKPTDVQIKGVREAVARVFAKYPNASKIKPHQHFVPTQCPGGPALRLINDGVFDPDYENQSRLRQRIKKVRGRISDLRDLLRRLVGRLS